LQAGGLLIHSHTSRAADGHRHLRERLVMAGDAGRDLHKLRTALLQEADRALSGVFDRGRVGSAGLSENRFDRRVPPPVGPGHRRLPGLVHGLGVETQPQELRDQSRFSGFVVRGPHERRGARPVPGLDIGALLDHRSQQFQVLIEHGKEHGRKADKRRLVRIRAAGQQALRLRGIVAHQRAD